MLCLILEHTQQAPGLRLGCSGRGNFLALLSVGTHLDRHWDHTWKMKKDVKWDKTKGLKDKVSVLRTHGRTSCVKIKSRRHSRCIKNTGWLLGYFVEKNKKLTDNI